jgi:hypothetical protein
MLLRLFCLRGEERIVKQAGKTRRARERPAGEPLQKKPSVQQVLVRAAFSGKWI